MLARPAGSAAGACGAAALTPLRSAARSAHAVAAHHMLRAGIGLLRGAGAQRVPQEGLGAVQC